MAACAVVAGSPPAVQAPPEAPPWAAGAFDARKKPRPAPRLQAYVARPRRPDAAPQATEEEAEAEEVVRGPSCSAAAAAKPRWGRLEEGSGRADAVAEGATSPAAASAVAVETDAAIVFQDNARLVKSQLIPAPAPGQATASSTVGAPLPADYNLTWQRWRSMPTSVLDKKNELLRLAQPPRESKPPSAEALAFLESLLAGTEPTAPAVSRAELGGADLPVSRGTAEVLRGAARLRKLAAESRRRATAAVDAAKSQRGRHAAARSTLREPCSCVGPEATTAADCAHQQGQSQHQAAAYCNTREGHLRAGPKMANDGARGEEQSGRHAAAPRNADTRCSRAGQEGTTIGDSTWGQEQSGPSATAHINTRERCLGAGQKGTTIPDSTLDQEQLAQERQREHKRQLRELELEADRERLRLQAGMEQEQAERLAQRRAQEAWEEELRRKIERAKRDAKSAAHVQERAKSSANAEWQSQWWRDWQRAEESARERADERHPRAREPQARGQEQRRHEERRSTEETPTADCGESAPSTQRPRCPKMPPPPAAAKTASVEHQVVLQELCTRRREPLEDRKRAWRALCLRWHPDKSNGEGANTATAAFQYLQGLPNRQSTRHVFAVQRCLQISCWAYNAGKLQEDGWLGESFKSDARAPRKD